MDSIAPPHRALAYFLLRITLGAIFLVFGLQKLAMGPRVFSDAVAGQFAQGPLPLFLVRAFGFVLPFLETGLGVLMILGLFTVAVLSLTQVLLLVLTFGLAVSGQGQNIPGNLGYIVVCFVLLFAAEHNRWALDERCRRG